MEKECDPQIPQAHTPLLEGDLCGAPGWLTCGERRRVLRKKPSRQPTMTDSTDRMSRPFRLHTSLPLARMAPGTMVSPACWHGAQHHSMHGRPAGGTGSWLEALAPQQVGDQEC